MPRSKTSAARHIDASTNWIVPCFFALAVVLGGTSQNVFFPKFILVNLSLIILAFVLYRTRGETHRTIFHYRNWPFFLVWCYGWLQLVPVPSFIQAGFPDADVIRTVTQTVQGDTKPVSVSLTPERTLSALFICIPFFTALLIGHRSGDDDRIKKICTAIVMAAILSALLGLLQKVTGDTRFYPYDVTNFGYGVGFFANSNHQATFLMIAITLLLFSPSYEPIMQNNGHRKSFNLRPFIFLSASFILLTAALLATGSVMGIALTGLVVTMKCVQLIIDNRKSRRKPKKLNMLSGLAAALITLGIIWDLHIPQKIYAIAYADLEASRFLLFGTTTQAAKAFFPWGSGFGTFEPAYKMFETFDDITFAYAPHAHNEYLQLWLEQGLIGLIAMIAFAVIWGPLLLKAIFRSPATRNDALCFAIVIITVFIHSLVDYPARTGAVSVILGFSLGIISLKSVPGSPRKKGLVKPVKTD